MSAVLASVPCSRSSEVRLLREHWEHWEVEKIRELLKKNIVEGVCGALWVGETLGSGLDLPP